VVVVKELVKPELLVEVEAVAEAPARRLPTAARIPARRAARRPVRRRR
jgi:hypothetical protein